MTLVRRWRDVWRGDRGSSDMAMLGEHRVAQSRVLLVGTLTLLGLLVFGAQPGNDGYRQAVPVNLFCLAAALVFLWLTRRGTRPTWLAYTTSLWDVSVVSLLHVVELTQGLSSTAANGRVTFLGYFLALVGTCVRWDRRLPLLVGGVAAAQYAGIAAWSAATWAQAPPSDIAAYGAFDAGVQVERIVTLLLFAVICRSIVGWALELRESAVVDALTGLLNRRTFEARLHDAVLAASRTGAPLTVAMVDIDLFKRVNDEHGHAAGDVALRAVAHTIRNAVRRTDLVARWGGEEFAVVFPDTPLAESAQKVERMREALSDTAIGLPGGVQVHLTVSAGLACTAIDGTEPGPLTQVADGRLFEAKRAGRNRVVWTASE